MDKMFTATRKFAFYAETKGAYRYAEVLEGMSPVIIGTLYIRKEALRMAGYNGKAPEEITVTVEDK